MHYLDFARFLDRDSCEGQLQKLIRIKLGEAVVRINHPARAFHSLFLHGFYENELEHFLLRHQGRPIDLFNFVLDTCCKRSDFSPQKEMTTSMNNYLGITLVLK